MAANNRGTRTNADSFQSDPQEPPSAAPQALQLEPAVRDCLERAQQTLLVAGYEYVEGEPADWPATVVLMARDEDVLAAAPLELADQAVRRLAERKDYKYKGLLLVGSISTNQADVRRRIQTAPTTAAYLDAQGDAWLLERRLSFWRRENLRPFQAYNLCRLLDGRCLDSKALRIDCRTVLAQHLTDLRESAQFMDQARKNSAVKVTWLTFLLALACAAIFLAMGILHPDTLNRPSPKTLIAWGANYGPLVADGQWWRVLTSGFLHAGFPHMAANVMILVLLGIIVETLQGRWRLAMLFLFSIVTGSLASIAAHPTTVGVGASGGLFGLMGAWAALGIRFHREFPSGLRKRLAKALAILVGVNALFSILPMVDWAAHLGGFVGGLALGLLIVRSPVRIGWPGVWVWPALAALTLATLMFSGWAVARVPADAPRNLPESKLDHLQRLRRQDELIRLDKDLVPYLGPGPQSRPHRNAPLTGNKATDERRLSP